MSTELEEVVADPDVISAEQLRPDAGNHPPPERGVAKFLLGPSLRPARCIGANGQLHIGSGKTATLYVLALADSNAPAGIDGLAGTHRA